MNIALLKGTASELKEVVVTSAYGTKREARSVSSSVAAASIPLTVSEKENSTSF